MKPKSCDHEEPSAPLMVSEVIQIAEPVYFVSAEEVSAVAILEADDVMVVEEEKRNITSTTNNNNSLSSFHLNPQNIHNNKLEYLNPSKLPSDDNYEPSAPREAQIAQSVFVAESEEIRLESDLNDNNAHRKYLDHEIKHGNKHDGKQIVQAEHLATKTSTSLGNSLSASLDRKIIHSNQDKVDSFAIHSIVTCPIVTTNTADTLKPQQTPAITASSSTTFGEYKIGEYKSIYETASGSDSASQTQGYVMSEYKSMYD